MKFNNFHLLSLISSFACVQNKTPVYDINHSEPLNILLHSSIGGRSHIKGILEIGEELSKRGHNLSYIGYEENLRFLQGYNIGNYSLGNSFMDNKQMRNSMKRNIGFKSGQNHIEMFNSLTKILMQDYEVTFTPLKKYLIQNKPDILHCDFFSHSCLDLAKHLQIPLIIGLQTTDIFGILSEPFLTQHLEYVPITTKDMNFLDRFYYQVINPIMGMRYIIPSLNKQNEVREKYNIPHSYSMVGDFNYGLVIANTFMGFEPAIPLHPNLFQVGPLVSENKDHLSDELKQFLDINERTLFIAFGSNAVLNEGITKRILEAALLAINEDVIDGVVWGLGRTNQGDFPMEVNDGKEGNIKVADLFNGAHPKIKLLSWAPQVSILNHDNTKLFISHGGLESSFEAIYSGTPILCFALFGDQPRNARKLEEMGTGVYVDKSNFTPESLKGQFKLILEDKNNQFEYNLQRMKTITHHTSRRINFAADLFEQHGYTAKSCRQYEPYDINSNLPPCEIKHLIPVSNQMSFVKANNIDIYGAAVLLFLVGLVVASTVIYWAVKLALTVYNSVNQLKPKVD